MTSPKRRPPRKPGRSRTGTAVLKTNLKSGTYALEEQVGHLLRRAHQRHTALFAKHMDPGGITPTQWAALYKLRELGVASQNELGRLTAIDAATMQGLVQRLIHRGVVAQEQDARDRRRNQLSLTPAGRVFVEAHVPNAKRITRLTLAPLAPEQQKILVRLLRQLA
jgi:MarR family transcriptional regulator, lower aerobic nicotinate degradation pathway regulator